MMRRVTITLDDKLDSKIRTIQAKKILEATKSVSYSKVIEEILREGLKAYSKCHLFMILKTQAILI